MRERCGGRLRPRDGRDDWRCRLRLECGIDAPVPFGPLVEPAAGIDSLRLVKTLFATLGTSRHSAAICYRSAWRSSEIGGAKTITPSRSGILATPREPRSTLVGLVQWSGRKSSKPTANRQRRLTGSMDVYRARYSRHRLVGICLSLTPLSADVRFGSRDRGHTPPLR